MYALFGMTLMVATAASLAFELMTEDLSPRWDQSEASNDLYKEADLILRRRKIVKGFFNQKVPKEYN